MAFVSTSFIIFLSIIALVYFLVPLNHRWKVLLIASYIYFWINSEWLLVIMFATTAVTFLTAAFIQKIFHNSNQFLQANKSLLSPKERKSHKEQAKLRAKRVLLGGVCFDLGLLLVLKYFNFFASIPNQLLGQFGIVIPQVRFLLPIGISFYTLQAIAYMTDVYRGKYEADHDFFKFMLFMSYFPQIVQGPIPRYNQLAHQLYEGHTFSYQRLAFGSQLILWGFLKKLIIADRIAIPTNLIFDNYQDYSGIIVFLGAVFYGIQVYADFSGGMDIARGISQIFGIELELNFRQPYFSRSIEDFWRRWHITLGGWMRDYVFYPLSLSKSFAKLGKHARNIFGSFFGKRLPAFLSMFIVYFLVGFWHGPEWKYIAYGVWNGVFIVAGILLTDVYVAVRKKLRIPEQSASWRFFQIFRTFILVSMGRFFSRAADLSAALDMFKRMWTDWYDLSPLFNGSMTELNLDTGNWLVLIAGIVLLLVVDSLHERDIHIREHIAQQNIIFRWSIYYAACILLAIFGIYGPGFDSASFIYAQF